MIIVQIIPNPLHSAGRKQLSFSGPRILSQCVPEECHQWRVIVNGQAMEEGNDWQQLVPDHAIIVVTRKIGDPITLTIVSAAVLMSSLIVNVGYIFTMMALMGLAQGLFAMMAPQKPKMASSKGLEESPTYGWDGIQTMSDVGIPVPIIYGRHLTGGNVIASYIDNIGNDSYLNMLIALSEGPIKSIAGYTVDGDYTTPNLVTIGDNLLLDDAAVGDMASGDVGVYVRLGNEEQDPIPGFCDLVERVTVPGSPLLTQGKPVIYTTDNTDVEKLRVQIVLDSLIEFDDSRDGTGPAAAQFKVEYRVHGVDAWTTHGILSRTAQTMNRVRLTYTLSDLTRAQYDLRVTQLSANSGDREGIKADAHWSAVDEIRLDDLSYPYTALLGLRIKATERFSGTTPGVKVIVEGRKVTVNAGSSGEAIEYSQNPIWCLRDLLVSPRYGVGKYVNTAQMDDAYFAAMAAYADEQVVVEGQSGTEDRFHLDIVIDQSQAALETLQEIANTCRMFLFWVDGGVRPVIDKPDSLVAMFGRGNIIQGTFGVDYTSVKNSPNQIELQFPDADNDYERTTIAIEDDEALMAGDPPRTQSHFLPGITRISQVARSGRYLLKLGKYCIRIAKWKSSINAVVCQAGDVVGVSHDMVEWGASGRVKSGGSANNTISLDCNVWIPELAVGETVVVQVHHKDDSIEERTVLFAAGFSGLGGETYPANTEFTVGPSASGEPTDWLRRPEAYEIVSIGVNPVKPFRIVSITRADNNEVTIEAIEYIEDVYDDTDTSVDIIDYSSLANPKQPPQQVENLQADSVPSYNPLVYISYEVPEESESYGFFDHAEIWLQRTGDTAWTMVGVNRYGDYRVANLTPGQSYTFKAVAVSKWGTKASFDDAPTIAIALRPGRPPNVTGLEIRGQGNVNEFFTRDVVFQWKSVRSMGAVHPAGEEPLGAGAGAMDRYFQDYIVQISHGTLASAIIKRTEVPTVNEYAYTWDKNVADANATLLPGHVTVPSNIPRYGSRYIVVKVWARDIFNQVSENPAVLYVYNARPAKVEMLTINRVSRDGNYIYTELSWDWVESPDVVGYKVWRSTTGYGSLTADGASENMDFSDATLIYDGTANRFTIMLQSVLVAYIVGAYDAFGSLIYYAGWNSGPSDVQVTYTDITGSP